MRKIAIVLLTVVIFCLFIIPASAESTADGWSYTLNGNGGVEINGYSGNAANVEIPENLDGHPVTGIGAFAFFQNDKLISVTISGCVKTIGESAFSFCTNLKSVTISDGVENIGMYVFAQCPELARVTVPDSVNSIGEMAFGYYTPNEIDFLKVSGFTIYGSTGSAAEQYAKDNEFSFCVQGSCTHDTLICEACGETFTKEELLAENNSGLSTGSALSGGNLAVIGTVAGVLIGIIGTLAVTKKSKS